MIVSWNWLKQYLPLEMPLEEFQRRLMLAGLNHEETKTVGDDFAIDLEITSNRPDCLGHIGIAREASVIFGLPLKVPDPRPAEAKPTAAELTKVTLECPDLCPRYTARVIKGVKVKPSPAWLVNRLATIGIGAINNVADITNYVLMECGQPLHAFDFQKLQGREIVVRRARAGERLEAINHKTYELEKEMCVIADRTAAGRAWGRHGWCSQRSQLRRRSTCLSRLRNSIRCRSAIRHANCRCIAIRRIDLSVASIRKEWIGPADAAAN